jgi:hypothetical protein
VEEVAGRQFQKTRGQAIQARISARGPAPAGEARLPLTETIRAVRPQPIVRHEQGAHVGPAALPGRTPRHLDHLLGILTRRRQGQRQHAAHEGQSPTGLRVAGQGDDRLRRAALGGEAGTRVSGVVTGTGHAGRDGEGAAGAAGPRLAHHDDAVRTPRPGTPPHGGQSPGGTHQLSARLGFSARACRNRGSVAEVAVVVGSPSSTRIEPCAWRCLPR